jgi:hypothetical protein
MTTYARIENNTAVEVFDPPVGFTLADCFHAEIAALFSAVPDGTETGATTADGGTTWTNPPTQPAPEPAAIYPKIGPIAFQMLFTPAESVAADSLKASDPTLASFWKLIDDPRTDVVDLSLKTVQNAIEYTLTVVKASGVDVDVPTRLAEILTGVVR